MAHDRPASQTAYGPMVTIAAEQHFAAAERLVTDELAAPILPAVYRSIVASCRWGPLRRLLVRTSEAKAPGIWAWMCGRKRYVDECAERAVADGLDALVVLGAGLDTRAARMVGRHPNLRAYEIDLPANVDVKRKRLHSLAEGSPPNLTLVPVDFEEADLVAELERHGFTLDRPAFFVWEGVSQYLTEPAVHATLRFLARAPSGSRLVFSYVREDFITGAQMYGAEDLHRALVERRRVWLYGIAPSRVDALLRPYGWTEREQFGAAEVARDYVRPTGRSLAVSEIERCVYAERI